MRRRGRGYIVEGPLGFGDCGAKHWHREIMTQKKVMRGREFTGLFALEKI